MTVSRSLSRRIAALRRRRARERRGEALVEGVRAVGMALDSGADVQVFVESPRLRATPGGDAVRARLVEAGVPGVLIRIAGMQPPKIPPL